MRAALRAAPASDPAVAETSTGAAILAMLGRHARALRQRRSLTLRALADRSGLSLRFLMDVEAGRGNISVRRLAELAAALETSPAALLTVDPTEAPARVIALLGLRGAGKTSIGRRLARRLRLRFVELDHEIETRAGLALGEIFTLHGEEYYRRLEHDTLVDLLASGQSMVIAVGGGLVTAAETYALLRRRATTVWLRARPGDYWNRVIGQGDRRPIDQHPHAREALQALVARRDPLYARARLAVDTTGVTVARVVDRVERALAAQA
jgi:XRE family transcriptional regulator, aerobic/anaerobic benzoate catabolism transcriptional regulator